MKHRPGGIAQNSQGTCALCQRMTRLVKSHLVPKAAHRLMRHEDRTPRDPILIDGDVAVPTSQQVTCRLLCGACELRFSREGEERTLSVCRRGVEQFVLRDHLASLPTVARLVGRGSAVKVSGEVPVASLLHFAMGVVWKRSAGTWKLWGRRARHVPVLGPFEEAFRLYLLGEQPFPRHAEVILEVPVDDIVSGFVRYGDKGKTKAVPRTTAYQVAIPGLYFTVIVGKNIGGEVRECSLNGQGIVLLRPFEEMMSTTSILDAIKTSRPKGRWG